MEVGSSLGQCLKDLRESKMLTLREVEKKTGVSNPYLSQLESGKIRKPSPLILDKMARFYDVPYSLLMEKAGYPAPRTEESQPGENNLLRRLGHISQSEERDLLEYLAFIRSRPKRRRRR